MHNKRWLTVALLLIPLAAKVTAGSEDGAVEAAEPRMHGPAEFEVAPRYRTREEAREAGLERELTDWLTLSTLFETEIAHTRKVDEEGVSDGVNEETLTFQLGMSLDLSETVSVEFVTEYDSDENRFLTEEAFLALEYEPWELTLGKRYTPFGSYFSRFVSGPMVEFGETQADKSVSLSYGPGDKLDVTLMFYQGRATEYGGNENDWNWSLGLESWPTDSLSFGLSYQADLADSDEGLLAELGHRYRERVAGASAYLLFVRNEYEFSIEFLQTLSSFRELASDRDRPFAWNTEVSRYFTGSEIEIAFRLEGSRELMEMPTQRYGVALTHYATPRAYFTIEYLHARFSKHAVFPEEDDRLDHSGQFAAKLTIEL